MNGLGVVRDLSDGEGGRMRVLVQGGVWQSATYLGECRMEPVFEYIAAFEDGFSLRPDARRVLAIGGGGFSFPKLVAARHPGVGCDAVEIDPAVVRAARRWFFLDEACELARAGGGELRVLCDDGRHVLDAAPAGAYDLLALDAFAGSEPVVALADEGAARAARRTLGERGLYMANVTSRYGGEDLGFLDAQVELLQRVFAHVDVVCAADDRAAETNYLVVASDSAL